MKKKLMIVAVAAASVFFAVSCNDDNSKKTEESTTTEPTSSSGDNATTTNDPKGVGKFKNVELTHPLDPKMVASGKTVYDMKCASCHKLSAEKLVGPGWKGVTDRRQPEWIMNFVTNTEEMLDKDAESKKMMEVCLVKMPNQNLSDDDARRVLEYMRENDGKK